MNKLIKKLFYILFMLILISVISFLAIHAAPNSFFGAGELNPNMTEEAIAALKAVYGLDKPLSQQYVDWVINIFSLNFGISFVTGQDVSSEILKRLPVTLIMNITALVAVFVISLYLGIKAALNYEKKSDYIIRQISLVSFSMPSFYLSLLFIILFSLTLDIFPIAGLHSIEPKEGVAYYLDMAWHLVLPVGVMIFVGLGSMIIYIRSLTLEILKSDYYYFALSRGLKKKELLRFYILPNLFPPIITLLGLSLPGLIGGSVILESIFGIEGMGQLFYMSAMSRDYPIIMGTLMITAFLTLIGNMIADLILLKLNPYMSR
ncbi:MAG: peptide ABC transporter permease [Sulfurimonas sp. RIFCSPHIGHO2_12_FULL_36_9]|uniref:ABC transporter permease n=1 Tax=Sulfurimonas sp. RIFCSPLOWO2_12_36_12 TaxID=1802253 RepID=UPI0008BA9CCC|nr:ABC transporter permease [Sulfurimonas sp. RIFCSPLOWO2_12_36_12]OHD97727.1 MAG: peptide ABC transporter permease [Sulfurimonas sp. RIFCSPHIGHO2_12_FULL_36_9]OHD98573.1 MAG: peptide ABC transporter permease [Sulfurimonas sp. RIFCSPLOWO2_02_FULL_36_28]OHE01397.1 MAG: peptide ABC transporter permease [Sulfurimonas sp. RIFCSPLOWO2_12_36_12]OHE06497.1 MAG: peptide ABC transporter permease [Sulfurimonas sp. RIFCSPLOWO2_12_FULL_36_74]